MESSFLSSAITAGMSQDQKDKFNEEYHEDIYVGYRYYTKRGKVDPDFDYKKEVQYSFGHGLSYTTFDWELIASKPAKNQPINGNQEIELQVKVTNQGNRSGRDVVEAYLTAPYYDGEIEKSSVKLVGFQKTKLLIKIHKYEKNLYSCICFDRIRILRKSTSNLHLRIIRQRCIAKRLDRT